MSAACWDEHVWIAMCMYCGMRMSIAVSDSYRFDVPVCVILKCVLTGLWERNYVPSIVGGREATLG